MIRSRNTYHHLKKTDPSIILGCLESAVKRSKQINIENDSKDRVNLGGQVVADLRDKVQFKKKKHFINAFQFLCSQLSETEFSV